MDQKEKIRSTIVHLAAQHLNIPEDQVNDDTVIAPRYVDVPHLMENAVGIIKLPCRVDYAQEVLTVGGAIAMFSI